MRTKSYWKNKTDLIILILIIFIFFLIWLSKVWDFQYLYTIDPWHHMYYTQHVEPLSFFWRNIEVADWVLTTHYPTFMRSFLYEFHLVTGIDYISIFKYFGFLTRFLVAIFFLKILYVFVGERKYTYLWLLLLFSGYYFSYRINITFTENFVILFQSLILLCSLYFLNTNKKKYLFLTTFFTVVSLYYHYPSAVIPISIYSSTLFIFLIKNFNVKTIIQIWWNILVFLLLWFHSLIWVYYEYQKQYDLNIWETWWYWWWTNRFIAPSLIDYQSYQSYLIILFWFFWTIFFIKKYKYQYHNFFPFIVISLVTFILSNTTRFQLNLPTDRMQAYLMVPIWILAFIWCSYVVRNSSKSLIIVMSSLITVISFNNIINISWWFKISRWEIPTKEYLLETYRSDRNYFFDSYDLYDPKEKVVFEELEFPYYKNIIRYESSLKKWDWIISRWRIEGKKQIQNNGDIFIYEY